ncbi:putative nonribosomal siderophore peptide synthase [Golovinomyces cichoracearum]|uniref:Putative nonribosomal siderophore peptide synthase n=1 Tax=Golovinomyces cichoracearum TaxID=62708 RepID=A0A420HNK9_9PEZI|nr:putative nonribosomal siderophore peptide synthase [Golovinomyces cichoracearum]
MAKPLSILNDPAEILSGPQLLHDFVMWDHHPDKCAIDFTCGDRRQRYSYQDLQSCVAVLALKIKVILTSSQRATSNVIPVFLPQSPGLYISYLAILVSGNAFCPIKLDTPRNRIKFVVDNTATSILITTSDRHDLVSWEDGPTIILVDEFVAPPDNFQRIEMPLNVKPDDLAYVIYTSGSTGKPKGVQVTHMAVSQSLLAHQKHIPSFKRFLQFAAPSFDVSIFEIFFTLSRACTIVGCKRSQLLNDLSGTINTLKIDAAELTPTVISSLIERRSNVPELKLLISTGEFITIPILREFGGSEMKPSMLYGLYGPTEATIHCTISPEMSATAKPNNVGIPLSTVSTFIAVPISSAENAAKLKFLPIGEIGELVLAGPQLSRGYFKNPEQNNLAFVSLEGKKYYRTGDKARQLKDGSIELHGRIYEDQVKLRGQRVELGEIEAAIYRHPGIKFVTSTIVKDAIIGFAIVDDRVTNSKEVMETCAKWLPKSIMPREIILRAMFPYLASGKVDKKKLVLEYQEERICKYSDDQIIESEPERLVKSILYDIFGPFSRESQLSAIGLDSLSAIKVTSKLRASGFIIDIILLLQAQNLDELVKLCIDSKISSSQNSNLSLKGNQRNCKISQIHLNDLSDDIEYILPCTPQQLAMLSESIRDETLYRNWIKLDIKSPIKSENIIQILHDLSKSNPILRTGFMETQSPSGYIQFIYKKIHDTRFELVSSFKYEFNKLKDSSLEFPIRFQILSESSNLKVLIHIHHALYDAWTLDLLLDDLNSLLASKPLFKRPSFELVVNSFSEVEGSITKNWSIEDYWKDHLAYFNPKQLPSFCSNPTSVPVLSISRLQTSFLFSDVEAASRRLLTSSQSIFQAAFAIILSSYLGTSDICFGTVFSGRTLPVDGIENIVGPCIVTLPIRIDITTSETLCDIVQQLNSTNRKHLEYIKTPLRDIKMAGKFKSDIALFDTLLILQQTLHPSDILREHVSLIDSEDIVEFNLILEIIPHIGNIELKATYRQRIIPEFQVKLFLQQIEQLVRQILSKSERPLKSIYKILDQSLLSISNDDPENTHLDARLHSDVEEIALRDPNRPAIIFANSLCDNNFDLKTVSYSELNFRANKIARCLIELGASSDQLVCICLEKSIELYTCILATTKTGAAWLPLTPDTPLERLDYILRQSRVQVAVIHSSLWPKFASHSIKILLVDKIDISHFSANDLDLKASLDNLAYAIYTSGSTGKPKGVLISQRNILSNLSALESVYPKSKETRLLQFCSHTFDVSIGEIFFTWRIGGCLCSAINDVLFQDLEYAICTMKITHLSLTTTVASLINPENVPCVEFLVISGEVMTSRIYDSWVDRNLWIGYGPSETTNVVTLSSIGTGNFILGGIGYVLKNTSAFVLSSDSDFIPVPRGGEGELCFGGSQIFRGYMENENNEGKIIEHPKFGRIYRSGDYGRLMPNGSFVFLGRKDDRVKIRGQRVELGEINNTVISSNPEISNCTTILIEGKDHMDQRLVCFWTPKNQSLAELKFLQIDQTTVTRLHQSINSALPNYMIPSAMIPVTFFPTTPSGKIDSARLVNLFHEFSKLYFESSLHNIKSSSRYQFDPIEKEIAIAVAQVTHKSLIEIKADTSFFSLGFDSISAIHLAKILRQSINYQLTVSEILRFPSVVRLAERISDGKNKKSALLPITSKDFSFDQSFLKSIIRKYQVRGKKVQSILPCTPLQEAMLSAAELSTKMVYYSQVVFEIKIDIFKLEQLWKKMVQRHGILRTCFKRTELQKNIYAQVILSDYDLRFGSITQLSETGSSIDSFEPPYSLDILRSTKTNKLVISMHHALYDATAISILYDEIQALYYGQNLEPAISFEPFLMYLESNDLEKGDYFWTKYLKNCPFSKFTSEKPSIQFLASAQTHSIMSASSLRWVEMKSMKHETSLLSIFMTVWASVLAETLRETDVCFGNVISGRNIPIPGIERLVAPCFNTIPSRIKNIQDLSYIEAYRIFQNLNAEVLPFQFMPLRRIQSKLSHDGSPLFDTIFVMQRPKQKLDDSIWSIDKDSGYTQFPLVFELILNNEEDNILIRLHSYSNIIAESDAIKILKLFDQRLHEGLQNPRVQLLNSTLRAELIHEKRFPQTKKKLSTDHSLSRALSKDEIELRAIIAEFSDIPICKINISDSFFFLGLDSINILQFASRLRKRGHLVRASDILENSNIKKLNNFLKSQDKNLVRDMNLRTDTFANLKKSCYDYIYHKYGILKKNIETIRPCTSFQQGMIARTIQSDGREYFNSFWLKFPIQTSITKLKDAWTVACQNHEIFRSGFASTENVKFPFVMITHRNFTLPWVETDIQSQDEIETLKRLLYRPWCLKFRSLEDKIIIQFIVHHALYDAISIQMFFTDIARSYKSLDPINRLPINLLLNAILLESEKNTEEKKSFWNMDENKFRMNRFPDLNPVRIIETNCEVQEKILKSKSSALEARCRENSITMQTAAQAAWARLLVNYIGGTSITFGTVLSGRSAHEDADRIPFPSAVTLPVHCNVLGTNAELLARTMNFNLKVYRHQFTPLTFIQKLSESSNSRNFDTILTYQRTLISENDIKVPWEIFKEDSFVDYVLSLELLSLANDQLKSRLTFKVDVIPPKQAQIILNQYEELLYDLLLNPDNPCDIAPQIDLSLLSITPSKELELPGSATLVHEFVVCGAQDHPEKLAFEFATNLNIKNFQSKIWTYEELDKISNKVANYLLQFGFEPGEAIAVCFDKCPEAYFANIGILKAGYVYVALDPNSPIDRLKFILKDSGARAILMDGKTKEKSSYLFNKPILNLDFHTISSFSQEPPNLSRRIKPGDISYYLYTSGTTGTPKGCMITHENVVQFSRAFSRIFDGHWTNDSRFLQFASYHFDVSIMEQFWSWSVGICVVSAPRDIIFESITGAIQALGITHIDLTPSLARMINPEDVPSLCRGVFITGGEQLEKEILDKWSAFGCLYNAYGPTEATIGCTMNPRISSNDKPTNIGPAYVNVGTYVLKPDTELPTLRGGIGELCVSGKLICKGYLNNAVLTSQKFPTLKKSNERVYRTGDLVRILHDGSFMFLGRADSQVKLRGQRLEIIEIKEAIRKNVQEVEEIVILILKHKTQANDHLIAFFVTFSTDPSEIIQAMRSACKSWLPGYMVPSHFIPVKNIPLSINNKVDTKRLAALYNEFTIEDLQKLSLMSQQGSKWSLHEKEIISKISSALNVDESILKRNTNIFELGLDSISMIGFSCALQNLGLKNASLSVIRKNPAISGLVRALLSENLSDTKVYNAYMSASQKIIAFSQKHIFRVCKELGVEKDDIESITPCTPIQEGMIYKYMENEHALYFNKFLFRLLEKVNTQKLLAAWNNVVSYLEVLRIKFIATDDGFCQVVMRKNIVSWDRAKDYKTMDKMDALKNPFCLSLNKNVLTFQIFHGLYDENSLTLLLRHVISRYNDIQMIDYGPSFISSLPYGPLANIPGAEEFWNSHFKEWSPSSIPVDTSCTDYVTKITSFINLDGFEAIRKQLGVAPQAIIEACWIAALQTKLQLNFMMGIVVSGRAIELDTSKIVGPFFNTIPFYINFRPHATLKEVILVCQDFNMQMQEFQHTSLNDIKKWVQAKHGRFEIFQTIFNFQRQEMNLDELSNDLWQFIHSDPILDYPLALEAKLSSDSRQLSLSIFAHSSMLTKDNTAALMKRTEDCIREILGSEGKNRVSNSSVLQNYPSGIDYRFGLDFRSPAEDIVFYWTPDTLTIRKEIAILANISQDIVKESSSIYELGLDSIDVIKLFSRLKKQYMEITVSDIIKCQTISRMVCKIKKIKKNTDDSNTLLQNINQKLMAYFTESDILTDDVEIILPATPLQQSMVSKMEMSDFEIYFTVDGFKVSRNVDLIKLKDAIEIVIQASPILRTSFYEVDDPKIPVRYSQVVYKYLKNNFNFQSTKLDSEQTFDEYLNQFRKEIVIQAKKTRKLFYFQNVMAVGSNYLVIAISHALYDGKSLQLIHEDIRRAYNDQIVRRPDFMPYLEHILLSTTENAKSFWRARLSDLPATKIPVQKSNICDPNDSFLLKKKSRVLLADIEALCKSVKVTIQTLGQTCWALVLSHLMKQLDVAFGTVITGRNSEEAAEIMFPLMNTIILRSVIHGNLAEMLQYMQEINDSNFQYQNFPISTAQVYAFSSRKEFIKIDETNLFDSLFIYQGRQPAPDKNLLYEWKYGISEIDIPICVEMQISSDGYVSWTIACKSTARSRSETEDLLEALDFTLERTIHSTSSPSTIFHEDGVSICGLPKFIPNESRTDKRKSKGNIPRIENNSWSTIELLIRKSLCEISGVLEEDIQQNMTIYHLGLDSILVLKLPALLRNYGVKLNVSSILKGQTISEMSKSAEIVETNPSRSLDFKKILADATASSELSKELETLETEISRIQYVMPATAGQYFMIRQWQVNNGAIFNGGFKHFISSQFKRIDLESAWIMLLSRHEILRTGFLDDGINIYQVIFKNPPNEIIYCSEQGNLETHVSRSNLKRPPLNLIVQKLQNDTVRLNLMIHHALYDGISLQNLLSEFLSLYQGLKIESSALSFKPFVAQSIFYSSMSNMQEKWKSYLVHYDNSPSDPVNETAVKQRTNFMSHSNKILNLIQKAKEIGSSLDALFLAVLVKVQAERLQNRGPNISTKSLILGLYVANRAPYGDDLSMLMAPTLNVLPIRIHQPLEKSLERLAFEIQTDIHKITNSDMVSASLPQIFEWTGIRVDFSANIVRAPSSQASINVKFLHPSDMNLKTQSDNLWESIHASHEHTVLDKTPSPIATHSSKKAFLPMFEFELYHHEDMIDISISSPLHLISNEEADYFTRRFIKICSLEKPQFEYWIFVCNYTPITAVYPKGYVEMPVVKGGVWTNIEDEILKASVSKYGLNQWARVSSLLARKTPKQCKARWNEWLDPGIRKIEWSKEEDEKLLHLAKLMPTQWRTIAPIVGRTATQCLERYQRLLDEAEQKEAAELGLGGPDGGETKAPSADDVRRLRPGELDPDPESKPARPDTIDLDEDEKEMLSEARARKVNQDDDPERKRRKGDKEAPSASYQAAMKAGQQQKIREAEQSSKRKPLILPAPQVGERELEEIVKMGMIGERANVMAKASENDATKGLINTYSENHTGAPIRTPMAPPQENHIANEIRNIKALTNTQSSILGGENTPLYQGTGSTGFEGANPRKQQIATPNPLATPYSRINGIGATPMGPPRLPGETPLRTPRDKFALNSTGELQLVGNTPQEILFQDQAMKQKLKTGLLSLPKPKETDWELELPEPKKEPISNQEIPGEDAEIRDRRIKQAKEALEKAEFLRRTQVIQRGLPTPKSIDANSLLSRISEKTEPTQAAILRETILLQISDAISFGGQEIKLNPDISTLETFNDDALAQARSEINQAMTKEDVQRSNQISQELYQLLQPLSLYPASDHSKEDGCNQTDSFIQDAQESLISEATKNNKMEKKLSLHLGGYHKRAKTLRQKIVEASDALDKATYSLHSFRTLQMSESIAIQRRLESLKEEVAFISRRERLAQDLYRERIQELKQQTQK